MMNKDQAVALKLDDQPYLIIIPKAILQRRGINEEEISFDLVIEDNRLCLAAPIRKSI